MREFFTEKGGFMWLFILFILAPVIVSILPLFLLIMFMFAIAAVGVAITNKLNS